MSSVQHIPNIADTASSLRTSCHVPPALKIAPEAAWKATDPTIPAELRMEMAVA
eukprot:CAMPEP_0197856806 /NCGR_PEP_ID=MMETSP1438-20131217/29281_1 /TAXON_ID=1461541 /ORGANISM="Pterosperma sp., Strain CCMP1384" /LENGTH=53 /DNA_ID=CAMNT_0043472389 /DNA_START=404 /DNA_END=562 /DNA_ORIENTATION=+